MSAEWALQAPRTSALALARLPRHTGIAICDFSDELWLRGKSLSDQLNRAVRLVPGARLYALLSDGQLVPEDKLVPHGRLPEGRWQLLVDWLLENMAIPPLASLTSSSAPRVHTLQPIPLQLVRTGIMRESALLETTLTNFSDYVRTAPQWRIDRWSYAATAGGLVIVRGTPLPPLAGTQWCEQEAIYVPLGYSWEPTIAPALVRRLLELADDDSALLRPEGTRDSIIVDRVAADHWVRCTRSSVRITSESLVR